MRAGAEVALAMTPRLRLDPDAAATSAMVAAGPPM